MKYLTEEGLGIFLNVLYPDEFWIHNKSLNKKYKFRPDYVSEKNKIIVEFNGYRHYNNSRVIIHDEQKYKIEKDLGYEIIVIPYFVQLEEKTIKLLFKKDFKYELQYPHGFIDKKALLPCDFCYLGIQRFLNDLIYFDIIKKDIIISLKNKVLEKNNEKLVIPLIADFIKLLK